MIRLLNQLRKRSRSNLLATFGIVYGRWRAHPRDRVRASLKSTPYLLPWIVLWLVMIVVVALTLDVPAANARHSWPHWEVTVAQFFTKFALTGWYLAPSVLILVAANLTDWRSLTRREVAFGTNWTSFALLVFLSVGTSSLVGLFAKMLFGRARVDQFTELGAFHFSPTLFDRDMNSFPSGHSIVIGAVATAISLLCPRARPYVIPLSLLVAVSRVVVGDHYPSDVVAGFGLGIFCTIFIANIFARVGFVFSRVDNSFIKRKNNFHLYFFSSADIHSLVYTSK